MKMSKLFAGVTISALFITGCASLTGPEEGTGGPVSIAVYKPASNDSVSQGYNEIIYDVSTAEGIKFIELYVNGKFVRNYPPNQDGTRPSIKWYLDSTQIGQRVNYYLTYYDKNGLSSRSDSMVNILVTENKNPPLTPYNVNLLRLSATIVNISWSDSSVNEEGYEIWRKLGPQGTYEKRITAPANSFNINDEGLDPNAVYFYKIRSFNKFGASDFTREINSHGTYSSGTVAAPTNLVASAVGTRKVRLSWKDNSDNENYFKIERRHTYSEFEAVGFAPRNATTFTDSMNGLIPGIVYFYRVKAYSSNDSAWSNESSTQTFPYDIKPPTGLTATTQGSRKVVLNWLDNDLYNTYYEIERRYENSANFESVALISGLLNSYIDSLVEAQQFYTYRVRATDGLYYSDYSNEVTIFTGILTLPAPTDLKAVYMSGNIMRLTWNYSAATAATFVIERKNLTTGGSYAVIAEISALTKQYDDPGTQAGNFYMYRVRARNGNAYSSYSNEVTVLNTGS